MRKIDIRNKKRPIITKEDVITAAMKTEKILIRDGQESVVTYAADDAVALSLCFDKIKAVRARELADQMIKEGYWSICRSFDLSELQGMIFKLYRDLEERIKEWVIDNDISPTYKAADSIYINVEGTVHTGVVIGVNREEAIYFVIVKDINEENGSPVIFHAKIEDYL